MDDGVRRRDGDGAHALRDDDGAPAQADGKGGTGGNWVGARAEQAGQTGGASAEQVGRTGGASVELVGLTALLALLALAAIAALAAEGEIEGGRDLAATISRRIACAPRLPGPCRRHPLVTAYGWPLARLARALAPAPVARTGPSGLPLAPVDFRRCRRESCAVPLPGAAGAHLTGSGRRTTAFTRVVDRRRTLGWVELTYWLYRPGLGWERLVRRAAPAQIAAAAGVAVLVRDDPALVPLETLPGRDHYEFPAEEQPPWRWQIRGIYPGWSS